MGSVGTAGLAIDCLVVVVSPTNGPDSGGAAA